MIALPAGIGLVAPVSGGGSYPSYRHWRIYITANNGDVYTSANEIELRSTPGGVDQSASGSAACAASSDYFGSNGALAFDGNTSDTSAWVTSGAALPQWVSNDLGSIKPIAEVAIWPESSGGYVRPPKDFEIQGCDDGASWVTVKAYTNITGWSSFGAGGGGYRTFSTV